ncbi:E3 ubiquitin-protein ligase RNF113A-like [Dysidea avara]|uniref:E3 ubiquitin-protein ligase RNF113A-like n=1 Tax=Dysidea avara TaxID=196820 RepID=UPI0033291C51
MSGVDSGPKVCTFKKSRGRAAVFRKRKYTSSGEDDSDEESAVVKVTKRSRKGGLVEKTNNVRGSNKGEIQDVMSSDDEDDKKLTTFSFRSSKSKQPEGPQDQGATSVLQIETEHDQDAQALFEKSQKINKNLEGKVDDKVYRGQGNYLQYYEKKDTVQGNASSGMNRKGPIRAPLHLRATVRWDYQPDICKDWKETGYCGFGDSCKFLHDRSDYKSGWQLDREFEENEKPEDDDAYVISSSDEDDQLPFACFLCRERFKNPVITKCGHYFCEVCALKQFKKSMKCAVCSKQTNGVFNPAKDLIAKIEKKEAELRRKAEDEEHRPPPE